METADEGRSMLMSQSCVVQKEMEVTCRSRRRPTGEELTENEHRSGGEKRCWYALHTTLLLKAESLLFTRPCSTKTVAATWFGFNHTEVLEACGTVGVWFCTAATAASRFCLILQMQKESRFSFKSFYRFKRCDEYIFRNQTGQTFLMHYC